MNKQETKQLSEEELSNYSDLMAQEVCLFLGWLLETSIAERNRDEIVVTFSKDTISEAFGNDEMERYFAEK